MTYREIIKKVQEYSGFSNSESKDAIQLMVESLAVHLNEGERKDFASQLPSELQDIALTVMPTRKSAKEDILNQFIELQSVDESRAKRQIHAAWRVLKEAVSPGEIEHIRTQLPNRTVIFLH